MLLNSFLILVLLRIAGRVIFITSYSDFEFSECCEIFVKKKGIFGGLP